MEQSGRADSITRAKGAQAAQTESDALHQGRDDKFMDIDRMLNEGLGGGYVTINNAKIGDTTADTMDNPESVVAEEAPSSES